MWPPRGTFPIHSNVINSSMHKTVTNFAVLVVTPICFFEKYLSTALLEFLNSWMGLPVRGIDYLFKMFHQVIVLLEYILIFF